MCSIQSESTQKCLLLEANLRLTEAIEFVISSKAADRNAQELKEVAHASASLWNGQDLLLLSSIGRGRKGRGNMKWVDTAEEEEKEPQATILPVGGQQIPPLKVSLKLKERWTQGLQYH